MAVVRETLARPRLSLNSNLDWIRKNLFNTWYNALLTLASLGFIYFVMKAVLTWVIITADWTPVTANLTLFMVGQYPSEQIWRVGLNLLIVSLLLGLSWGVWGGVVRTFALALGVGLGVIALLPLSLETLSLNGRLWLLANTALVFVGYRLGRTAIGKPRWILIGWLFSFVLSFLLLRGFEGSNQLPLVAPTKWGGLLLTFILALVGIVASLPLGVLFALGRRSRLPVVSLFSTLFIELVRGVPLVTILFMASIIFALFLPEDLRIDRVLRALIGITLFSAAYMAENVRGGLQSVPQGQVEAAKALGLSGPLITILIVLPQALRNIIPVIVGQFIALFKDTTLVVIVGLLEILGIGKAIILGHVEWVGLQMEVFLFIAATFWLFTYTMSYASRKLETALGVGER